MPFGLGDMATASEEELTIVTKNLEAIEGIFEEE